MYAEEKHLKILKYTALRGGGVVKCLPAMQDKQETQGRLLGEEMATHSSILSWEIPWVEEPGGLQSMGLQRVKHS